MLNSIALATHAEALGYHRIWFGEHHTNILFNSCAPEILIAIVATQTSTIRLGAGSILLNYHTPFRIAEAFAYLSTLFPQRIDLGLGRNASGTVLDKAFNSSIPDNPDASVKIRELVQWLENSFPADHAFSNLQIPGQDNIPEVWISGSSVGSAKMAATLSLPYIFADFFSPALTTQALAEYSKSFAPQESQVRVRRPTSMVCFRVICCETLEEVRRLIAPLLVMGNEVKRGTFTHTLTPEEAIQELGYLPEVDKAIQENELLANMVLGTPLMVEDAIMKKISNLEVDELMIQDLILDHDARLKSYELISSVIK